MSGVTNLRARASFPQRATLGAMVRENVPLVGRAVNSTDGSSFVPRSFRSDRLAALERLRGDGAGGVLLVLEERRLERLQPLQQRRLLPARRRLLEQPIDDDGR